jgi:hypothetical protein
MRYCSGTLVKQFLSNFTYVVLTQKMRYCSETEEKKSLVIIQEDQMKRNVHFVKIVVKTTYDI